MFDENAAEYNRLAKEGKAPDIRNMNLSDLDLTSFSLKNADLSGCYLRGANLKGLDLSEANLNGASIKNAFISGTLFPRGLGACEIQMSHSFGTRLRQG
jgi:uncharacterized protein YjbI with pentapeptide repeats